ncbi:MAG: HD-GYP domain-containing protein [Chloroflexota bacterium]
MTLTIETIPLPLAGVLFSDSVHEKILNRYNMDAGVVLFEKSHDEYYLDSVIGIQSFNSKEQHLFSEICAEVNLNLESLNGSTNPLQNQLPDIPALNQFIADGEFKGVRIFKIYDYIHTSGYWMMFYKLDPNPDLPRLPGLFSPDSLYMVDEIKKNLEQQSKQISIDEIIPRWTRLLDIRDKETEEHTHRVVNLAVELGKKCGLDAQELEHLRLGAFLHDIGKVVIPNDILHKDGPLTDAEWEIMKLHPRIAKELLINLSLPQAVLDIPLYHHERWSGCGYPYGLEGEQIPLPVRIFSVVDVWDALNADRPYRKRWVEQQARKYIAENMWTEFDPEVARIFLEI